MKLQIEETKEEDKRELQDAKFQYDQELEEYREVEHKIRAEWDDKISAEFTFSSDAKKIIENMGQQTGNYDRSATVSEKIVE